jgi:hypothetical protein
MGSEAPQWAKAFGQAAKMLGHQVELHTRSYGRTKHYWVSCDCGYASSPGNSFRFAMSAGVGHIQRVSKALEPAARPTRDTPTAVDIPQVRPAVG